MIHRLFKRWQALRLFSDEEAAAFFGLDVERWIAVKNDARKVPSSQLGKLLDRAGLRDQLEDESFQLGLTKLGRELADAAPLTEEESLYAIRKYGDIARRAK